MKDFVIHQVSNTRYEVRLTNVASPFAVIIATEVIFDYPYIKFFYNMTLVVEFSSKYAELVLTKF